MDRKLISRIVTSLVGVPLLILVIGWGSPWQFSLLVLLLTGCALREYFSIALAGQRKEQTLGMFSGLWLALGILISGGAHAAMWLGVVVVAVFATYLSFGGKLAERYSRLGWSLLGILYIGYFVPHLALLHQSHEGREWVFFLLLVIMTGDTAGYFVGSLLGRRKLAPDISPGKTVEGAVGNVVASVAVGLVGGRFLLSSLSWLELLMLSLVLSLIGQIGDLFESWIKRAFAVKDSGALLPGHGGLLDRMDSLIFSAVLIVYYVRLLHS